MEQWNREADLRPELRLVLDAVEDVSRARLALAEARAQRARAVRAAVEAGVSRATIGGILGVTRQRIAQMMQEQAQLQGRRQQLP